MTNAFARAIIINVESDNASDKQNIGDLHSGSAVDSDSTCGGSIPSSPTKRLGRCSGRLFIVLLHTAAQQIIRLPLSAATFGRRSVLLRISNHAVSVCMRPTEIDRPIAPDRIARVGMNMAFR